ncbi:MAG: PEP-CTERM sorting domain-containing protein [Akkermansiaceae bacterium]|nr:PEP-CTERM sorting domain-containing protein [Akkermansiaceae bacterium]
MQAPLPLHVGLVMACTLNLVSAQSIDWTDWTSVNGTNDVATGSLLIDGTINATVSVSGCVAGTVIDGTSTAFSNAALFSPALVTSDTLRSDHNGSIPAMGDFVITFSSAITNPFFHLKENHHGFQAFDHTTGTPIATEIVSGNLVHTPGDNTTLGADTWTGGFMLIGSDTNNFGTTADGSFYLLGTYTQIRIRSINEDIVFYQIGDDDHVAPVPEPSTLWLGMLGFFFLLRRRK